MTTLHQEPGTVPGSAPPLRRERMADDPATGWRTFRVYRGRRAVGVLAEWRKWTGTRYGPPRWIACLNPTGREDGTTWASASQTTQAAALRLLRGRVRIERDATTGKAA
jgi:hypothetical protein